MISTIDGKTIQLPYPTEPKWHASLSDVVVQATAAIAAAAKSTAQTRTTLVLHGQPDKRTPLHIRLSMKEALRSLMHTSVLEQPSLGINLVIALTLDDPDLQTTLKYLAGPEGEFVQGATIDLGEGA